MQSLIERQVAPCINTCGLACASILNAEANQWGIDDDRSIIVVQLCLCEADPHLTLPTNAVCARARSPGPPEMSLILIGRACGIFDSNVHASVTLASFAKPF